MNNPEKNRTNTRLDEIRGMSADDCAALIGELSADIECITEGLAAAKLRYDCGEDIDWDWHNRAATARQHKRIQLSAAHQRKNVLEREERAARAAEGHRLHLEKEARKTANIERARHEDTEKLVEVLRIVKNEAPDLLPAIYSAFRRVEEKFRQEMK